MPDGSKHISNIIFLCVVLVHSVVVYDFFQVNNALMPHILRLMIAITYFQLEDIFP